MINIIEIYRVMRLSSLPRKRFKLDYEYMRKHRKEICLETDPVIPLAFECEEYEWWRTDIGPFKPAADYMPNCVGDFKN